MRGLACGFGILAVTHASWFVFLQAERFSTVLVSVYFLSPLIAGFVASTLSARRKVLAGASMAVPATVLTVSVHLVYQGLGHTVDFPGAEGGILVAETAFVWSALLSTAGGAAGRLLGGSRVQMQAEDQ